MRPFFGFPSAKQPRRGDDQRRTAACGRSRGHLFLQPSDESEGLERLPQTLIIRVEHAGMTGSPCIDLPFQGFPLMVEQPRGCRPRRFHWDKRLARLVQRQPVFLDEVLVDDDHGRTRWFFAIVVLIAIAGSIVLQQRSRLFNPDDPRKLVTNLFRRRDTLALVIHLGNSGFDRGIDCVAQFRHRLLVEADPDATEFERENLR